ncbi:unnamed protein product [Strongylus vulgaris]|uniref:Uncharacterized protein n=1 Tax=Strongylus vulgaris TaxID=40348 RepID=A0A3P7JHD8_STRVU|nr:unnamed protein product [Strongylus vulgaris]
MSISALALFDHVNALWGSLLDLCTPATCQYMSYPGTTKAYYIDERGKRHLYSAPQYMDCVMSFCEKSSRSEELFPTKYGRSTEDKPKLQGSAFQVTSFRVILSPILDGLFACYGIAAGTWHRSIGMSWVSQLELRPQCALVMAHLAKLSKTFALLDSKDQQLINNMVQTIRPSNVASPGRGDDPSSGATQRWSRVPSSKSGSWGGHPTPAVLTCKPYAQTC